MQPFLFQSSLQGSEKPFTKNCVVGNVSSSLVSVKTKYQCCITTPFNCSNLFGSDFMLRFPVIISPQIRDLEVSLMDLLLAWFSKFNASFF